jgi:HAD superfamily hydrolase (TIGR01549 family)
MPSRYPPARGVIFDLDGTLVDSALDFDQMRREMGFPPGTPVLEGIAALPTDEAARCWAILEQHERAGCQRATCTPGAAELLGELAAQAFHRGLLTRNSRRFTEELIERLGLTFDAVMTRDDAPPKPDPEAIWRICEMWAIEPQLAAMVGDYRFDLEAGRGAGTRAVLYTAGRLRESLPAWASQADYVLSALHPADDFVRWLRETL